MSELSFDDLVALGIRGGRGRPATAVHAEHVRDLGEADVDELMHPSTKGPPANPIQKLRHTHHMLARLLAEGRKSEECSLITGYSTTRIWILKQDPAFKDLVAYYAAQTEAKFLDVHERLAALGMSTLDELQERLESDPDGFKNRELMELAEFALDRSVTKDSRKGGPQGTPPAVAITFVSGNGGVAQVPSFAPEDNPGKVIDLEILDGSET